MARPKFSDADKEKLRRLGVSEEQTNCLQVALVNIRRVVSARPTRSGTKALLKDIEDLAGELSRKLSALVTQPSPEYGWAYLLVEERYWNLPERQEDDGGMVPLHLVPRLSALANVAKSAHDSIPKGQTRQTQADPRAIRWIDDALLSGWLREQHDPVGTDRPLPPYPKDFAVSKAEKSKFRAIAGICFSAIGGNADPLRAIEAYLAVERKQRKEMLSKIEAEIAPKANRNGRPKKR